MLHNKLLLIGLSFERPYLIRPFLMQKPHDCKIRGFWTDFTSETTESTENPQNLPKSTDFRQNPWILVDFGLKVVKLTKFSFKSEDPRRTHQVFF